jgi:uncharacterized protein (TIGR02145 family)
MKKYLLNFFCLLILSNLLLAQAPDKMSYQAIVRNSNNLVVSNQTNKLNFHTNSDFKLRNFYKELITANIAEFNCTDTLHTGTITSNLPVSNCSSSISYTGGNGEIYSEQTIASTGVTGLTASLEAGTLNSGNGTLNLKITGTPLSEGVAFFTFVIGNKNCVVQRTVFPASTNSIWPTGSVFCNGTPTAIANVTNPLTGKTWMDRNLGASKVANSSTDLDAYGDLYQWGRAADGHQCRDSDTTRLLSSTDKPLSSKFILVSDSPPFDWHFPQNDNLWQGINGVNNPCPLGYRIPTLAELENERISWSQKNSIGAFNSPLKLPLSGTRKKSTGSLSNVGSYGYFWSSSIYGRGAWYLDFGSKSATIYNYGRSYGFSVRCIKD